MRAPLARTALWIEFILVFAVVPLLLPTLLRRAPGTLIPVLLLATLAIYLWLRTQPDWNRNRYFTRRGLRRYLREILIRDAAVAVLLALGVWWLRPDLLFNFARRAPIFWGAVMILYPIFSAFPQELIFRGFLLHRYAPLFPAKAAAALASASAFAFVHTIFGNWIALVLSFLGGLILARTYTVTSSLWLCALEHSLLGDSVFTVGLGQFFYHGTRFH